MRPVKPEEDIPQQNNKQYIRKYVVSFRNIDILSIPTHKSNQTVQRFQSWTEKTQMSITVLMGKLKAHDSYYYYVIIICHIWLMCCTSPVSLPCQKTVIVHKCTLEMWLPVKPHLYGHCSLRNQICHNMFSSLLPLAMNAPLHFDNHWPKSNIKALSSLLWIHF